MRCYFMRRGHIAGVEPIPGLSSEETLVRARELFAERQEAHGYDGFEVWDLARFLFRHPMPDLADNGGDCPA
jgi:hypothetical protein